VFVLLTHDHGDHIGDYFEMLKELTAAGVPVMTAGQSDLMRKGLIPDFKNAGLDPAKVVSNGGTGTNLLGFPAAGFIVDIGGTRVYISGDTDLFGDMKLIGERYQPNVAVVCVGGRPQHAIPVHYAHNNNVLGIQAGEEFRRAVAQIAPGIQVTVMKPGDTRTIEV
jgi:L-ascorbate metabolism protein UlaG (beta-lactamase superfamily)